MYICKYCNKEFDDYRKLGGHISKCKLNPNYENNKNQLEEARKHINKYRENKHLHCQYCNKEVANEACLCLHERSCINNPNAILSKTKLYKLNRILNNIPKHKWSHPITEQARKNMSNASKKRCKDHPETCGWKGKISKPCENLKQYLRNKGINFVEEYVPLNNRFFSLDIAWPDEKIAIEVNGNQHYDNDGNLKEYYQKRHNLLCQNGWKIFEIHYTKCNNININNFEDILKLPIYDKEYTKEYFQTLQYKKEQKNKERLIKQDLKQQEYNNRRQIIENLINNSGIDFTKFGWSQKAYNYLKERNELWNKGIFRCIRKYYPEFFQIKNIYIRKGSKI